MKNGYFKSFPSCFGTMLALSLTAVPCLAREGKAPPLKVASKQDPGPSHSPSKLQVSDAWVRLPPPGSQMVAVYLTITNSGSTLAQLTGVQVDGAMSSDLHETSVDQAGVSSMRMISSLDIPPGEAKSLSPGGLHVMVMGLNRHLREGDQLGVSLHFKDRPALQISAVVKP